MPQIDEVIAKIKSGELQYSAPETFDIPGVEIFASGKWNGDTYTEKDLDMIVESFNELKDKVKPYLKIGHGADQTLLREDELPSAGWISNLKRVGKKLVADFVRIPKKIYEVMKRGAYSRISSELWWDIPIDGKTYPRVLKAVSILGGETPAVHDLDDILSLYEIGLKAECSQHKLRRDHMRSLWPLKKRRTVCLRQKNCRPVMLHSRRPIRPSMV